MPSSKSKLVCAVVFVLCDVGVALSAAPINIGNRLELFADNFLLSELKGSAKLHLHRPTEHEVVFRADAKWEKGGLFFVSIFRDEDILRMYYLTGDNRVSHEGHWDLKVAYAESADGTHWVRPKLGLFEWEGEGTNIIFQRSTAEAPYAATPIDARKDGMGFMPGEAVTGFFKDSNPNAAPDAKYKAVGESGAYDALLGFKSPDGIHWSSVNDGNPILAVDKATKSSGGQFFDCQNIVFWDAQLDQYVMYFRDHSGPVRRIRMLTSPDFEKWDFSQSKRLIYPGLPDGEEQNSQSIAGRQNMFTIATMLYDRAPHMTIGFPTYMANFVVNEDGQTVESPLRWTEPHFMSSRDGLTFRRWTDALIPRDTPKRQELYGNFITHGLVKLPGRESEYAIYAQEGDFNNSIGQVRRFSYRTDGFVSIRALEAGGEFVTKPLVFMGDELVLNFRTLNASGSVRVELQDANGTPLNQFTLADCQPIAGDSLECVVKWTEGTDVSSLEGQVVRLRIVLKNADLFSLRFRSKEKSPSAAAPLPATHGDSLARLKTTASQAEEYIPEHLFDPDGLMYSYVDVRTGKPFDEAYVRHFKHNVRRAQRWSKELRPHSDPVTYWAYEDTIATAGYYIEALVLKYEVTGDKSALEEAFKVWAPYRHVFYVSQSYGTGNFLRPYGGFAGGFKGMSRWMEPLGYQAGNLLSGQYALWKHADEQTKQELADIIVRTLSWYEQQDFNYVWYKSEIHSWKNGGDRAGGYYLPAIAFAAHVTGNQKWANLLREKLPLAQGSGTQLMTTFKWGSDLVMLAELMGADFEKAFPLHTLAKSYDESIKHLATFTLPGMSAPIGKGARWRPSELGFFYLCGLAGIGYPGASEKLLEVLSVPTKVPEDFTVFLNEDSDKLPEEEYTRLQSLAVGRPLVLWYRNYWILRKAMMATGR